MLIIRHRKKLLPPLVAVLLSCFGYALLQIHQNNFHEVIPGELYRSGQFYEGDVQRYAQQYGIRSIINLRGDNTGKPWYENEIADAQKAGVQHINFRMSSKEMLNQQEMQALIETMRHAPKPLLVHCSGGANRTSFAVAVYLAEVKQASEERAEEQMSIFYGNIPEWLGSRSKMSRNFEAMEEALGYEGS